MNGIPGSVPLGPGAEFDAIRQLLATLGSRAAGVGDDAAIVVVPRGDALIASVDTHVEGRHFRSEWLTPRQVGYRAVAAALSDLAAMAAVPLGVLVALAVPEPWRDRLADVAEGIGEALDVVNAPVIGGNLSAAAEFSITTTVLGAAFAPLTRGGARPGDHVYLTGRLGAPAEALRRLTAGEPVGPYGDRLVRPVPRITEARWLATQGVTAAIDLSDGLVADAHHVARASGVTVQLTIDDVPCVPGVSADAAVRSGEEYELLVTGPAALNTREFEQRFHLALTRIGRVVPGPGTVEAGGHSTGPESGFDHFSR